MRILHGHRHAVRALAYAPGGLLLSAGDDRTVRVWVPATGEEVAALGSLLFFVVLIGVAPAWLLEVIDSYARALIGR